MHERALFRISRDDGLTSITAALPTDGGVEEETTLDLLGVLGMALIAMLSQERADLFLKEFEILRRGRRL
jgi:hypothetical protein